MENNKPPNMKLSRRRFDHMVRLTSDECEYLDYEVIDVLTAFYNVLRRELYLGNSILIDKLGKIQIKKPKPRLIYDVKANDGSKKLSPANPKLTITPSIGLLDYIRATEGTKLIVQEGVGSQRMIHANGKKNKRRYDEIRKAKNKRRRELAKIKREIFFPQLSLPRGQ